jgi:streptogramin lyase
LPATEYRGETRFRRIGAIASAGIIAAGAFAAAAAAKPSGPGPGNSPNAKACQKGGWEDLARSDGTGFSSERECTSYAARGGTLMPAGQSVYQSSHTSLYTRDVATGDATLVGTFGLGANDAMQDIATAPNGTVYGIGISNGSIGYLYTIDPNTGAATAVGPTDDEICPALEFSTSGVLYTSCEVDSDSTGLYTIDPSTGATTLVGEHGISASAFVNDLAFDDQGTLYATVIEGTESTLATVDPATGAVTPIGSIGHSLALGLTVLDGTLYAATFGGSLVRIDSTTGAGTVIDAAGPQATGLTPVP